MVKRGNDSVKISMDCDVSFSDNAVTHQRREGGMVLISWCARKAFCMKIADSDDSGGLRDER